MGPDGNWLLLRPYSNIMEGRIFGETGSGKGSVFAVALLKGESQVNKIEKGRVNHERDNC